MKGVILAAGLGTRLKSSVPKPLTVIFKEKTILDFQISYLAKKIGKENIIIVIGYKKDLITKKIPGLNFIFNHEFQSTNTSKSLLLGLDKISEDVIWMNGDIYFEERVLDLLMNSDHSCCLVDDKKCGEEEVKYSTNQNCFIKELSKSVKIPMGEALGINLIKKKDLDNFRSELEKVGKNDYFEKALENLIKKNKLNLSSIQVGKLFCTEIDFQKDLEDVRKYLQNP